MNNWCHINNILHVQNWRCLVAQFRYHALMVSLMISSGQTVDQIWNCYILKNISVSVDQWLKILEMLMAIVLTYLYSGFISGKSLSRPQNGGNFKMFKRIQFDFNMKRSSQNMSENLLMVMTSFITPSGSPQVNMLYYFINEIRKHKFFNLKTKKKLQTVFMFSIVGYGGKL